MCTATFTPAVRRFAWKEYRMLRGLWLSVAALAIVEQATSSLLSAPGADLPAWLFGSALAAAALYAVGAAAILFAVEHEDETYSFLAGLPTTWFPVFAGKLLVATLTSLLLAALLIAVSPFFAHGGRWPSPAIAGQLTGLFGVAILEALAWGTLFSLLLHQPLLAALLAIGTASVSVHAIVNLLPQTILPSVQLRSYLATTPLRLMIVVGVFVIDILLARRWLMTVPNRARLASATSSGAELPTFRIRFTSFSAELFRLLPRTGADRAGRSPLAVAARLLWQSWRQSWKLMFAMCAIVLALTAIAIVFIGLLADLLFWRWNAEFSVFAEVALSMSIVATALYASAIFSADQRRERFRFLAEHAAWPRYVWFSRLAIWSLPLAALALVAALAVVVFAMPQIDWWTQRAVESVQAYDDVSTMRRQAASWSIYRILIDSAAAAMVGVLTGFAIGQCSSMLVRRALVAGLLAVILAVVASAWSATISLWELPRLWFILPIPLSLLIATWLRAPDWIIGRTRPRAWLKLAAVVALPLFVMVASLPGARLRQVAVSPHDVEPMRGSLLLPDAIKTPEALGNAVESRISDELRRYQSVNTSVAFANGDKLLRTAETMAYVEKPWLDKTARSEAAIGRDYDPTPADLREWQRAKVAANGETINHAVELSRLPECRFPPIERRYWDAPLHHFRELCDLLVDAGDFATENGDLDDALEKYFAALRIDGDFRRGQNTGIFALDYADRDTCEHLVNWAASKGQTADRIRHAIAELDVIYPGITSSPQQTTPPTQYIPPRFEDSLVADYLRLHDMLLEKRSPTNIYELSSPDFIAYLANKLPFERERALRVLDFLAVYNVGQWTLAQKLWVEEDKLRNDAIEPDPEARAKLAAKLAFNLRQVLQSYRELDGNRRYPYEISRWAPPPVSWLRTSYLLRLEYQDQYAVGGCMCRVADSNVFTLGLKLQLALVAYRSEHGEYPDKFDALVPDYLPYVPLDPYSGASFQYEPHGLPGPFCGYVAQLPTNTPFFWSVGRRNGSLAKSPWQPPNSDDPKAGKTNDDQPEFQFTFNSNDSFYNEVAQLLFPLPK